MNGPTNANRTRRTNTARLTIASRWRRKRLSTSWPCVRVLVASNSCESDCGALFTTPPSDAKLMLAKANPRVEDAVHDVGDQVEQHDPRRGDPEPAHQHGRGELPHGAHEQRAHARPAQHRLGDDRAG